MDVMNGAQRVHWLKFKVSVPQGLPSTMVVSTWRKDSEDTDDYAGVHPGMVQRAETSLVARFGPEAQIEFVGESVCYGV